MVVTDRLISVYDGLVTLDVTWNDTTDALTSVTVTNSLDISVQAVIYRSSGVEWKRVTIPPGTQTFASGGPVKKFSDIPILGIL